MNADCKRHSSSEAWISAPVGRYVYSYAVFHLSLAQSQRGDMCKEFDIVFLIMIYLKYPPERDNII